MERSPGLSGSRKISQLVVSFLLLCYTVWQQIYGSGINQAVLTQLPCERCGRKSGKPVGLLSGGTISVLVWRWVSILHHAQIILNCWARSFGLERR